MIVVAPTVIGNLVELILASHISRLVFTSIDLVGKEHTAQNNNHKAEDCYSTSLMC